MFKLGPQQGRAMLRFKTLKHINWLFAHLHLWPIVICVSFNSSRGTGSELNRTLSLEL